MEIVSYISATFSQHLIKYTQSATFVSQKTHFWDFLAISVPYNETRKLNISAHFKKNIIDGGLFAMLPSVMSGAFMCKDVSLRYKYGGKPSKKSIPTMK